MKEIPLTQGKTKLPMNISSYPSIFNFGHGAVKQILREEVLVECKIDGSQISFMLTADGELLMRSKGSPINVVAPEGMFKLGVEAVLAIKDKLIPGYTYRGEYLARPKHNVLAYDRVPAQYIMIYDIQYGPEAYLTPEAKKEEAARLGFETVPLFFRGKLDSPTQLRAFLDRESVLGGQKIEGVVVKPAKYDLFGRDKKCLLAKLVSEGFKEAHKREWVPGTKPGKDIIALIGSQYTTEARWAKAVIHLKERGLLQGEPRDIGLLIKEVPLDIEKEHADEIKAELWGWAWPQIRRAVIRGLPEWYKNQLLKQSFEEGAHDIGGEIAAVGADAGNILSAGAGAPNGTPAVADSQGSGPAPRISER